jgi:hypothetical protein
MFDVELSKKPSMMIPMGIPKPYILPCAGPMASGPARKGDQRKLGTDRGTASGSGWRLENRSFSWTKRALMI